MTFFVVVFKQPCFGLVVNGVTTFGGSVSFWGGYVVKFPIYILMFIGLLFISKKHVSVLSYNLHNIHIVTVQSHPLQF